MVSKPAVAKRSRFSNPRSNVNGFETASNAFCALNFRGFLPNTGMRDT